MPKMRVEKEEWWPVLVLRDPTSVDEGVEIPDDLIWRLQEAEREHHEAQDAIYGWLDRNPGGGWPS